MSIRGRKLSKDLLLWSADEPQPDGGATAPDLRAQRNELMMHRFVYYRLQNKGMMHEYLVRKVAAEFFLSEVTVGEIIQDNAGRVTAIRREMPNNKELRKRWPWLIW